MRDKGFVHLFVYGTLQHAHVWRSVVRGEYTSRQAILEGFMASELKGAVYPGLIKKEGEITPGMVYFDISREDILRLDAFEGNNYERVEVYPMLNNNESVITHAYMYKGSKNMLVNVPWSYEQYLKFGHEKFLAGYGGWRKI
jgi:gamma-glutamylcyclotransferase (GGCT)/AIG2-like uncharacterized protein YtfP